MNMNKSKIKLLSTKRDFALQLQTIKWQNQTG